ncbi:MAG: sulfite exporter TauE/SafE family protein [Legionellaceae bacterium]|nr:sulfite exporter TauE/SafE family protein [Legionellaceae bacterium]
MLIILGFFLASIMGLLLGLIGSGGSMLTVPILVYLFGMKPLIAAGYSLLVVGSTAAVGVVSYWRQGLIKTRDTFVFVLPSTLMILLTRGFIVPALPDPILTLGDYVLPRGVFIMSLFAFLMLLAGSLMLKPVAARPKNQAPYDPYEHPVKLYLGSGMVGLLAGLVGAGGGFLIIPVLIILFGLSMKQAIGTSLAVIMVNSLLGFQGDWLIAGLEINWSVLAPFLGLAIFGMFIGIKFNQRVDGVKLKRGFAVFMLLLGCSILLKEIIFK